MAASGGPKENEQSPSKTGCKACGNNDPMSGFAVDDSKHLTLLPYCGITIPSDHVGW